MAYRKGDIGLPPVYIVIVNWNGKGYLPPLFTSLFNMSYKNFQIIFVDNGSKDGSVEWVKKFYPDVILVRNRKNLGYAKGSNIGIDIALRNGARYIAFLNTDMVVDKNWLSELLSTMEKDRKVGIVCSKILLMDMPWIINSTGIITNIDMYSRDRDYGKVDTGGLRESEVIAATGGAMMVRGKVFKKIGLFDPGLFLYYEDTDFSFRMRRYTDYRIVNNPYAVVWHKLWGSTQKIPYLREFYLSRNNYIMIFRYLPFRYILFRSLRILKVRAERKFYWKDAIGECKAFFSALLMFVPSILKRIYMDIKYGINYAYLNMLTQTKGIPLPIPYPPDYAERRKSLFPEKIPSSILFGINDDYLGDNWSILLDGEGLRYRRVEGEYAEIYLSSPKASNGYFQIHLSGNNRVKIYMEDKFLGEKAGIVGWKTLVYPVSFRENKKYYKVKIEGKGIIVNEVRLIGKDSSLLRDKQ